MELGLPAKVCKLPLFLRSGTATALLRGHYWLIMEPIILQLTVVCKLPPL